MAVLRQIAVDSTTAIVVGKGERERDSQAVVLERERRIRVRRCPPERQKPNDHLIAVPARQENRMVPTGKLCEELRLGTVLSYAD